MQLDFSKVYIDLQVYIEHNKNKTYCIYFNGSVMSQEHKRSYVTACVIVTLTDRRMTAQGTGVHHFHGVMDDRHTRKTHSFISRLLFLSPSRRKSPLEGTKRDV